MTKTDLILTIVLLIPGYASMSQNIDKISNKVVKNVLQVDVKFNDNSGLNGFGFIIAGPFNGKLYAVSAYHIFTDYDRQDISNIKTIEVTFFHRDMNKRMKKKAKYINGNPHLDFCIIEIDDIRRYNWKDGFYDRKIERNDDVWFIGRGEQWYIPTKKYIGSVNRVDEKFVYADMIGVVQGSSGAPVLNKNGISGMIINDNLAEFTATRIDSILTNSVNWMKAEENEIFSYPYLSVGIAGGFSVHANPALRFYWGSNLEFSLSRSVSLSFDYNHNILKSYKAKQDSGFLQFRNRIHGIGPHLLLNIPELFNLQSLHGSFIKCGVLFSNNKPQFRTKKLGWTDLSDLSINGAPYFNEGNLDKRIRIYSLGLGTVFRTPGGSFATELSFYYANSRDMFTAPKRILNDKKNNDWFFQTGIRFQLSHGKSRSALFLYD